MTEQKDSVAKTAAQLGFRNPYDQVLRTPTSIDGAVASLFARVGEVDSAIYNLDIYTPNSRLWQLSTKQEEITKYNAQLPDSDETDPAQTKFNYLLRLGTQLLYAEAVDQRFTILKPHDADGLFLTGAALDTFNYAGDTLVRVEGVCLRDLQRYRPSGKQDSDQAVPFYRFLVNSYFTWMHDQEVLAENQQFPFNEYPPLADVRVGQVPWLSNAVVDAPEAMLDRYLLIQRGIPREAAGKAKGYLEKVRQIKDDTIRVLINPNSPYFETLREDMLRFTDPDFEGGNYAWEVLVGKDKKAIVDLYRAMTTHQYQDVEPDFYYNIACSLLGYIRGSEIPNILMLDDAQLITREGVDPQEITATGFDEAEMFEGMRKILNVASSQTKQREFKVDPNSVDFVDFVPPSSVQVNLDRSRPQMITIVMNYMGEDGEILDFQMRVDTTKKQFDWNLIDYPNAVQGLKVGGLVVVSNLVEQLKNEADETARQKQASQVVVVSPSPIKIKPTFEYHAPQKEVVQRQQALPMTPIRMELRKSGVEDGELVRVRNNIAMPEESELRKMLSGFTPEQQRAIVEGIRNYNERGVGEFKKLEKDENADIDYHSLRISVPAIKKGVRVKVYEGDPVNGTRNFSVKTIDLRSNIFKKK